MFRCCYRSPHILPPAVSLQIRRKPARSLKPVINRGSIGDEVMPRFEASSNKLSFLESRCGFCVLSDIESDVFRGFVGSMSKAVQWLVLYGVVDFIAVCRRVVLGIQVFPFAFGDLFYSIEAFAMAGVFRMCSHSFKKLFVKDTHSSDIPVIIEGVQRLNLAFSQVAFMSCAVAFFQTIDASCKTPVVLFPFSMMILLLAIIRISCLWWITRRYEPGTGDLAEFISAVQRADKSEQEQYSLLDRLALRVAGHSILGYSFLQRGLTRDTDGERNMEYEFSEFEENNIRMFVDALRFAWLAYTLETGAYVLQTVAALYLHDTKALITVGLNTFECTVMVGLLFKASTALDRIIGTKGKDMTNLLRGFGPNGGMTQVFVQMIGLFRSLVVAKVMTLVV